MVDLTITHSLNNFHVYFLAYFRLGKVKKGYGLPRKLDIGSHWVIAPHGLKIVINKREHIDKI